MRSIAFAISLLLGAYAMPAEAKPIRSEMAIPLPWKACEQNADCMIVDKDCEDCCNFDALARAHYQAFRYEKQSFCPQPQKTCDCTLSDAQQPICQNNLCVVGTP